MNTFSKLAPLFAVSVFMFVGCQNAADSPDRSNTSESSSDTTHGHDGHDHEGHGHAHPSEGPHHGDLIELGNEEYHGEVVHNDEHGTLEIYILDSSATKQVAIEATEVIVNVSHDGKPEQFTLNASPDDGDESGKSSRFVSEDKELAAHLDEDGTTPRLVVKIDGKTYRGDIHHDHDHEGHDHGQDDDGHDHGDH